MKKNYPGFFGFKTHTRNIAEEIDEINEKLDAILEYLGKKTERIETHLELVSRREKCEE